MSYEQQFDWRYGSDNYHLGATIIVDPNQGPQDPVEVVESGPHTKEDLFLRTIGSAIHSNMTREIAPLFPDQRPLKRSVAIDADVLKSIMERIKKGSAITTLEEVTPAPQTVPRFKYMTKDGIAVGYGQGIHEDTARFSVPTRDVKDAFPPEYIRAMPFFWDDGVNDVVARQHKLVWNEDAKPELVSEETYDSIGKIDEDGNYVPSRTILPNSSPIVQQIIGNQDFAMHHYIQRLEEQGIAGTIENGYSQSYPIITDSEFWDLIGDNLGQHPVASTLMKEVELDPYGFVVESELISACSELAGALEDTTDSQLKRKLAITLIGLGGSLPSAE